MCRMTIGGTLSFKLARQNGSMSVLIPGPDPLVRRACVDLQDWLLVEWFSTVEPLAWLAVEARFCARRPDQIFLVLGQTLTMEYSITHQEHEASSCEASVETAAGIPSVVEANVFLGHRMQTASASGGFEVSAGRSERDGQPRRYSVYLEIHPSCPMKLLKRTLYKRISAMYK